MDTRAARWVPAATEPLTTVRFETPWSTIVLSMLLPGIRRAINRRRKSGYGIIGGHKSTAELHSTISDQASIL